MVQRTRKYKYKKKTTLSQYFDLATEVPWHLLLEAGKAQVREPQTEQRGGSPGGGGTPYNSENVKCPWSHPRSLVADARLSWRTHDSQSRKYKTRGQQSAEQLCKNWQEGSKGEQPGSNKPGLLWRVH